jgi:NAD(P) transhydrogenase subunit alpha
VVKHGVTICGHTNLPATLPVHSSQLYAKNVTELLKLIVTKDGQLKLDFADEIIQGATVTHDGRNVKAS